MAEAKAVEGRAHGRAIGTQHADFDIVSGGHICRQLERPIHVVEIVASRPEEAVGPLRFRSTVTQQLDRKAPAKVRSIEQGAILVGIGPYTNFRLLDQKYPGILKDASLYLMGGYVYDVPPGYHEWDKRDDWNIQLDVASARHVLENCPHMMLVAEGAERFAAQQGLTLCAPEDLISEAERDAWLKCRNSKHAAAHHRGHEQGTVGAVALDRDGRLFAATSTGGTCCKLPGRLGDSPLIGCGCYADAEAGGVSCTGYGEAIMKIVMAKTAADFLRSPAGPGPAPAPSITPKPSAADVAAREAVRILAKRTRATGGLILLDRKGNPGFAFNTPRMAHAYVSEGNFVVGV